MSLALWEYFWTASDWAVANATSTTITGPASGTVDTVSSFFTGGADGSISGTLVITLLNAGGTGVFAPTTLTLSSGGATQTFTYLPSTLGTHRIFSTNNQAGLADAATLTYEVVAVPTIPTGSGGGKHHHQHYQALPDEFWETRERYIRRFIEPTVQRSRESVSTELEFPAAQQAARQITRATIAQAKLRSLQTERDTLLTKLHVVQNRAELQQLSTRVLQLSLDILKTNDQYYEQAAIILLLDIY